ncbi:MAG TPA: hypothetical protein VGF56_02095 [Rhizomicrobium sp.]|jgi:hypothetical protein
MSDFYKFLNSKHIDLLLNGSIQISSLAYFRYLEDESGNSLIGDKLEGQSEIYQSSPLVIDSQSMGDADRRRLRTRGVYISPTAGSSNGKVTLSDSTFVRRDAHSLIFSFTSAEVESGTKIFCDDPPEPCFRYDACVRICDAALLEHAIWETATIEEYPSARLSDIFYSIRTGKIEYADKRADFMESREVSASAFVKSVAYERQSEHRVVFVPKNSRERDRLHLRLPNAGEYFREVFRDRDVGLGTASCQTVRQRPLQEVYEECIVFLAAYQERRSQCYQLGTMPSVQAIEAEDRIDDEMYPTAFRLMWEARMLGPRLYSELPYMPGRAGPMLLDIERIAEIAKRVLHGSSDRVGR